MNRTLLISILKKVFFISGVALTAFALTIKWIIPYYFTPGFGLNQIIVIVTGVVLITVSFLISGTIKSKIIENTAILFFSYLFFEIIVSLLYVTDVLEPWESIWAFEDSGKTIHFDPIRGYYLTQIPSRCMRITKGTIEYIGVIKGNNEGFPDQDNFYPKRDSQIAKRFAVFGDSFSAAQYIEKNWPDSVEKITHGRNIPIQLLNFSVDGGGLANWWSILIKIVESEHYEIDGVIFAVLPDDLNRKFSISDDQGQTRHMFARLPSWNPASYPATLEAARIYLQPLDGNIISTEKFNRLLKGDWTPPSVKNFRFYFAWKIMNIINNISHYKLPLQEFTEFDKEQKKLIEDVKRSITAINVPVLVVHIPTRPELLEGVVDKNLLAESRSFADLLGAKYIDGKLAFANNSHDEIKAMWLPYDGHWGQKGSDRFAEFMADILSEWP